MKSCSTLQITGERTSLSLYSKLDLGWCLWRGDLQLLLTRCLTFSALSSLRWYFTAPALFWHSFMTSSRHWQSWPAPGTSQDSPRSPEIQVKLHHNPTIIKDHKTIFTMARQLVTMLVTASLATCAISVLAWCSRGIRLATVQALWNKLQLLLSTPLIKHSHWSGQDTPPNTWKYLASLLICCCWLPYLPLIHCNKSADPAWYLPITLN